jgi:large repetitive protein
MPSSGRIGSKVGILGQGFTTSSVVRFGGVMAGPVTLTGSTYLTVAVPANALSGGVTVATGSSKLSCKPTFHVTPALKSFSPTSGSVGTPVTLTGSGLTQTTKVTFNGTSAAFTVNSDTQVTATVPLGATTGKIVITTKGGTATSATNFTVM